MKSTERKVLTAAFTLASVCVFQYAQAQHFDIELTGSCTGTVQISNTSVPIDSATGYKIFETDFGELGNPYGTDDPGYLSSQGALCAQEILWYEGAGPLEYWDGSSWSTVVSDAERVHIYGVLGEDTIFSGSGVLGDLYGAIDQADSSGNLHSHVDYEVENSLGSQAPATGAYLIPVKLYGDDHPTIETFYIAFNLDMSDTDFDAAIAERTSP